MCLKHVVFIERSRISADFFFKFIQYNFRMQLSGSSDLACIIRGKPNSFDESSVTCKEIDQLDIDLIYGPQEELMGSIIQLAPTSENIKLQVNIIILSRNFLERGCVINNLLSRQQLIN